MIFTLSVVFISYEKHYICCFYHCKSETPTIVLKASIAVCFAWLGPWHALQTQQEPKYSLSLAAVFSPVTLLLIEGFPFPSYHLFAVFVYFFLIALHSESFGI